MDSVANMLLLLLVGTLAAVYAAAYLLGFLWGLWEARRHD